MRVVDRKLTNGDIILAVTRFPTIFAAAQRVAKANNEHCTREDFAHAVSRYDVEYMRRCEYRFASLPQTVREALIKDFMQ